MTTLHTIAEEHVSTSTFPLIGFSGEAEKDIQDINQMATSAELTLRGQREILEKNGVIQFVDALLGDVKRLIQQTFSIRAEVKDGSQVLIQDQPNDDCEQQLSERLQELTQLYRLESAWEVDGRNPLEAADFFAILQSNIANYRADVLELTVQNESGRRKIKQEKIHDPALISQLLEAERVAQESTRIAQVLRFLKEQQS